MSNVEAIRRFNRFYTRQLGLLDRGHLASPWSLTEVRVLYELAHADELTASALTATLGLDPGYLSRLLAGFERRGLVKRTRSPHDARATLLELTPKGRRTFAGLDARAIAHVEGLIARLPDGDQGRLVGAMREIRGLLGDATNRTEAPVVLRAPRPGDLGWIVERHGAVYDASYGWGVRFEAMVAQVVATFAAGHDPARERCWIAERDGERLGCIMSCAKSKTVAQLRLLLVEPAARGLGVGSRLVAEVTRFARRAGYKKLVLWTNKGLDDARRLYEREGYVLTHEEPHALFGRGLVAQTWELALSPARPRPSGS